MDNQSKTGTGLVWIRDVKGGIPSAPFHASLFISFFCLHVLRTANSPNRYVGFR
jgi:hypothetical protein